MQIIARDTHPDLAAMLNVYDCPAILVTADYRILVANQRYLDSFGSIPAEEPARCYRVSHGYDVPCDQAGEQCPLQQAMASGERERVLHIHQTPRGREHVDVELLPLLDERGQLKYFVELLKPVAHASPQVDRSELVGNSLPFNQMVEDITRVGPTEATVLLLGESGTGKELAARAIHQASKRKHKAMVTLECAGLTEALFESELFGHVKGAFTGAISNKPGLADAANGGTLFLDEIGDVPPELQVKLLRLLETGSYRAVGSNETRRTDFRLICATHKDLGALVREGKFRQDLYFRINVFPIHLPALRERKQDIALLAGTMLRRLQQGRDCILTEGAISLLRQQDWPGNVRELRNILARALVLTNTNVIDHHVIGRCLDIDRRERGWSSALGQAQVPVRAAVEPAGGGHWQEPVSLDLKQQERRWLRQLLQDCGGNKAQAAARAGISLRSLYRKLQQDPAHEDS
ncbi:MAG: sigma-54 interaction domain-containing protein [Pseudohongiellaceae bacterium]